MLGEAVIDMNPQQPLDPIVEAERQIAVLQYEQQQMYAELQRRDQIDASRDQLEASRQQQREARPPSCCVVPACRASSRPAPCGS